MLKNNRRLFCEKFPTWDIIRKYNKDYDDSQELGTRNIKIAMRRLRKFA
ncbi:MAG: hypothetical protein JWQ76_2860, partial [Ramlibacter sp.]|nr:hypothetical protein [Ramlibacter sp.]